MVAHIGSSPFLGRGDERINEVCNYVFQWVCGCVGIGLVFGFLVL